MSKIEKIRQKIESKILKEEYEFTTIKVQGVRPDKLLFVTDGDYWVQAMRLDELIFDKLKLSDFVVVALSQKDRNKELPYNHDFARFVATEMKDKLAQQFSVKSWIFFGNSYGALCGLNIACCFKDAFDVYVCQSPSMFLDGVENGKKNAQLYLKNGFNNQVYVSHGSREGEKFCKPIIDTFEKIEGVCLYQHKGGHNYDAWKRDLQRFCEKEFVKEKHQQIVVFIIDGKLAIDRQKGV